MTSQSVFKQIDQQDTHQDSSVGVIALEGWLSNLRGSKENVEKDLKTRKDIQNTKHLKLVKKAKKITKDIPYSQYMNSRLFIPENFSGNILEYCNMLSTDGIEFAEHVNTRIMDVIDFLEMATNNNIDAAYKHRLSPLLLDKASKNIIKKQGQYFPNITGSSLSKLGEVLDNTKQLDEVLEFAIIENYLSDKEYLEDILKKVDRVNELVRDVVEYMKHKSIYTPANVKPLATVVLLLANDVRELGLLSFRYNVMLGTSQKLAGKIVSDWKE